MASIFKIIFLVLFYTLGAFPLLLHAATYYVSTTGNDSAAGTSTSPFKTIQHAADLVNPGDIVIVKNGTYNFSGSTWGVILRRSGTATAPITFVAQNKWGAVLTGAGDSAFLFYHDSAGNGVHDISIEDFDTSGNADAGFYAANAAGTYNILIYGNKIHNNSGSGISIGSDNHHYTVDSNVIYSCGTNTPHDHGVYLRGHHQTIMNNFIYNIPHGYQIQLGLGSSTTPPADPANGDTFNIVNNSFGPNIASAATANIIFDSNGMSPTYQFRNVLVQGNLSYGGTGSLVRTYYNQDFYNKMVLNNNLWYGRSWRGWVNTFRFSTFGMFTLSNNVQGKDPLLVDPLHFNYHLQPSSPAIKAGVRYKARTHDADKNKIADVPAIGAYELDRSRAASFRNDRKKTSEGY